MIAIQKAKGGFDDRWIAYCEAKGIKYKIVDSYSTDIIYQLTDCNAFMWQFYQSNPKDILMAKQLLFAIEQKGIMVFPNFKTAWHFDDKVGQKYLLEVIAAPLVPTYVFYEKFEALEWAKKTHFPKVFKLRGGAGSQNVRLVQSLTDAERLIKKAFSRGFPIYDPIGSLRERLRLYKLGKSNLRDLIEGLARFIIPPPYAKVRGREKGYIYFQDFVPGNDHDIRIIVIDDKAFAIKRMVRKGDFRASGGGDILYDNILIGEESLKLSFEIASKLDTQCVAFDFVYYNSIPLVVEISYGFSPAGYVDCPGYWDKDLNWHEGKFDPYGWMVEGVLKGIEKKDEK